MFANRNMDAATAILQEVMFAEEALSPSSRGPRPAGRPGDELSLLRVGSGIGGVDLSDAADAALAAWTPTHRSTGAVQAASCV